MRKRRRRRTQDYRFRGNGEFDSLIFTSMPPNHLADTSRTQVLPLAALRCRRASRRAKS